VIASIRGPEDVRALSANQMRALADEIRSFLVEKVTGRGGHLGPNLGVVELTLALHRVFESPSDRIVWDTGHQAYVHKIVTGRAAEFDGLRTRGGLSGYPSSAESVHDIVENSHASTSLSYAVGLAQGQRLRGLTDRHVVAVIGDGACTGGLAWEALNNLGTAGDLPVVVVLNDNTRSYDPTVGGLASHLSSLAGRSPDAAGGCPAVFEQLGLRYIGPVDGHDVAAVESALREATAVSGPVVVHCLTRKGNGYAPAENDEADRFHAVPVSDPVTGRPLAVAGPSWTSVFEAELARLGSVRPDLVAVTAAMLRPTGLGTFAALYPDRVFDAGIAEQHAVTSAAGLSLAGLRPVVALYATFLNRAFDQVLMDVGLHNCPVLFALDRAGVTGDDGASHNGMWDISLLNVVPGLRIAAPRDAATLRRSLGEALDQDSAPCVLRFPKGTVGEDITPVGRHHGLDVLRYSGSSDVMILTAGATARSGLAAADLLEPRGIAPTVVDPGWIKPVPDGVIPFAEEHRLVVTVEDGVRPGGFGGSVAQQLQDHHVSTPVVSVGLPERFLAHGTRAEVLADCGLTPCDIARAVLDHSAGRLRVSSGAGELAFDTIGRF